MIGLPGARWVLPLVLGVTLRLFPPGHSERAVPRDTTSPPLPSRLVLGSRRTARGSQPVFHLSAVVGPAPARLGQQLLYRGWVLSDEEDKVTFARPEAGGAFTWGEPRTGRRLLALAPGSAGYMSNRFYTPDSTWIEIPLQVFATGIVTIPGPRVVIRTTDAYRPVEARLPNVHLLVMPVLTAADTNATLRPVHGPLAAPWWERVPWRYVVAGAVLLAGLLAGIRAWRRRARRPVAAVAARGPVRPPVDPGAEALKALTALRAEHLPERGAFDAHALALTRILRRYLEARLVTPRPGDTSPELLQRLRASRLAAEDVQRLEGLLGLWDRVKFARAGLDVPEAQRCEVAVESLVRRSESPREVA